MKKENKKIKWKKLVTRTLTLFRLEALGQGMLKNLTEEIGYRLENQISVIRAGKGSYYLSEDDSKALAGAIVARVKANPNFFSENIMATLIACREFVETSQRISRRDLEGASNKELLELFEEFIDKHTKHTPYMMMPLFIQGYLSKVVTQALVEKFGEEKAREYFMILAFPIHKPRLSQAQLDLLKIASRAGSINRVSKETLVAHAEKYCWLKIDNPGEKVWTTDDYLAELKAIFDKDETPREQLKRTLSETKSRNQKVKKIVDKLQSDENLLKLISTLQQYVFLRTYRIEALDQAYYLATPLMVEIGNRLRVSVQEITAMTLKEIIDYLGKGKKPDLREVKRRIEKFAHVLRNGKVEVLTGSKVEEVEKKLEEEREGISKKDLKELKGQPIFPGLVKGKARIVLDIKDSKKVKKGDVLVAKMTTPDLILAIHKAGAIITDEGGITCHAAIISREFGIPCIIATHEATKVLKDGDLVEVNAEKGIIKILKRVK